MKILVIGGLGFIGSHTVDALNKEGHDVVVLDNLSEKIHKEKKIPEYDNKEAELIIGDVRNRDDLKNALQGVEAVYHFAAYQDYGSDFSTYFDVNTTGTALIYEVIVENKLPIEKVIIASSQAIYGEGWYVCNNEECKNLFQAEQRYKYELDSGIWNILCPACFTKATYLPFIEIGGSHPHNQYSISKYTQELIGFNFGQRYNIPTTCLRYSVVQGSRQSPWNMYSGFLRIICVNLLNHCSPIIFEDGLQIRDFVSIKDVVRANLLILNEPKADYMAFNIGGMISITLLEYFDKIKYILSEIIDDKSIMDITPIVNRYYRIGDVRNAYSICQPATSIGWEAEDTFGDMIKDYIIYLLENYNKETLDKLFENMKNITKNINVGEVKKYNYNDTSIWHGE